MNNLQSEFIEFHDKIKLSLDENKELRDKRDILLEKLSKNIADEAADYTIFNQGSYAMHTGIKPDDGDYDIDVGLRFDLSRDDYPDPVSVKKWVYDALEGHTEKVEIRKSCVTVTYKEDGEDAYHIDFACYSQEDEDLYIAKGKLESSEENRFWEESDPKGLLDNMGRHFSDKDDLAQFRRIIRYMKKWKNKHFESSGNSAPTGIALTALAYDNFEVQKAPNPVTGKYEYDDFGALKKFVDKIKKMFVKKYDYETGDSYHSIEQKLFVKPYNNLFAKMSKKQQEDFYKKIGMMLEKLCVAEGKEKKSEACNIMVEIFGSDFPVRVERSYVGHSESA